MRCRKASVQCSPVSRASASASSIRVTALSALGSSDSSSASRPCCSGMNPRMPSSANFPRTCRNSAMPASRSPSRARAHPRCRLPDSRYWAIPFFSAIATMVSASRSAAAASPRKISMIALKKKVLTRVAISPNSIARSRGLFDQLPRKLEFAELPTDICEADRRADSRIHAVAALDIAIPARIVSLDRRLELRTGLRKMPLTKACQTRHSAGGGKARKVILVPRFQQEGFCRLPRQFQVAPEQVAGPTARSTWPSARRHFVGCVTVS